MTLDESIANDTPVSHGPDDEPAPDSPDSPEGSPYMRQQVRDAMTRIRALETDITCIGEMLLAEAERRDWCDEYDDFCAKVNERLGRPALMPCSREFSAEFTVRLEWRSRHGQLDRSELNSRVYSALSYNLDWPGEVEDESIGVSNA